MKVIETITERHGILWLKKRTVHRVQMTSGVVRVIEKSPTPNHRAFECEPETQDVSDADLLDVMINTKKLFPSEAP
jgi:phenolic acid decarboxylase